MRQVKIQNTTHPLNQPLEACFCDTFLCRLKGLMFSSNISTEAGVLLVERRDSRLDAAIHMFFVNYELAVIWINGQKQVVDKRVAYRWRPFYMPSVSARYILEIHPNRIHDFLIGDIIDFRDE
jgi:uncharacterized membrane protein (UPF0127 family)